jgi:hypothetical protein
MPDHLLFDTMNTILHMFMFFTAVSYIAYKYNR